MYVSLIPSSFFVYSYFVYYLLTSSVIFYSVLSVLTRFKSSRTLRWGSLNSETAIWSPSDEFLSFFRHNTSSVYKGQDTNGECPDRYLVDETSHIKYEDVFGRIPENPTKVKTPSYSFREFLWTEVL